MSKDDSRLKLQSPTCEAVVSDSMTSFRAKSTTITYDEVWMAHLVKNLMLDFLTITNQNLSARVQWLQRKQIRKLALSTNLVQFVISVFGGSEGCAGG
jgi:hypothetical protein